MEASRQIYESLPNMISVPPELRRRRVEVIILPLDENGGGPSELSDEQLCNALENLMKHAGAVDSADSNSGDNERIDADLARESGRGLGDAD